MRWAAVVITGIAGALIASGCLDDPTFVQEPSDGGGTEAGIASSTSSSSSGGSSSSSSSTSSSTSSSGAGSSKSACANPTAPTNPCVMAGGKCEGATCAFRCPPAPPATPAQMMACSKEAACPPDTDCLIACGANACKKATCNEPNNACNVTCNGDNACGDQIAITSANGALTCNGNNACSKIDCEGTKCAVQCQTLTACSSNNFKCCATTSCTANSFPVTCKK